MMNQNNIETTKEDITLVDILKMFRGKLKMLICIALICAIIGALASLFVTALQIEYSAEIIFYLSPTESSQSLLHTLRSDSFAERLLLDENGLPPKDQCDPEDYENALAAVQAEQAARLRKHELSEAIIAFPYEFEEIKRRCDYLNDERSRIYGMLNMYQSAQDAIGSTPEHQAKIAKYEELYAEAEKVWIEYKNEFYNPMVEKKSQLDEDYFNAKNELTDARRVSLKMVDKVLSDWRKNKEVSALVDSIQRYVSYSYSTNKTSTTLHESTSNSNVSGESVEKPNSTFLAITVSVPKDKELANEIISLIKLRTPAFVEDRLERFTGETEAECILISTFAKAKASDESLPVKNLIIFCAIGAVAGVVVYSAIIITKGLLPDDFFPEKEKKEKKTKKSKKVAQ